MRVGVTGHQVLPREVEQALVLAIREMAVGDPLIVVGSLATGADQLAAREVLACGGSIEAIIPSQGYECTFEAGPPREEYVRLRALCRRISQLPFPEPTEAAFLAAGLLVVERCEHLLAAWDGKPACGMGGTADVIRYATREHLLVTNVWPSGVARA